MKKFFCIIMFFLFPGLLYGCKAPSKKPTVRVVTGITVNALGENENLTRTYTQDANMSHVLNYLRMLDPYIPVTLSPETFCSNSYQITVSYSDGNQTQYNQIYHDYFQTNNGPWKRIDPEVGARLQVLLNTLSNDI